VTIKYYYYCNTTLFQGITHHHYVRSLDPVLNCKAILTLKNALLLWRDKSKIFSPPSLLAYR